jgi:hypothetical protein
MAVETAASQKAKLKSKELLAKSKELQAAHLAEAETKLKEYLAKRATTAGTKKIATCQCESCWC